MPVLLLPAEDRRPQAWRDGGGQTSEIARAPHPDRPRDFLWRVSIADVTAAGPFSKFAGYQRLIAVIAGSGMSLRGIAPQDTVLLPFKVLRFDGAHAVEGLLPQGPVQDLNVIFDEALCSAHLLIGSGPGGRVLAAHTTLLVNLDTTRCEFRLAGDGGELAPRDAVQFTETRGVSLVWLGHAHVALIEIEY